MRFISVSDLRERSAEVWGVLDGEGEMIITRHGRPIAVLASVAESNSENLLAAIRQARAVRAVAELQTAGAASGRVRPEEIDAEITAARATTPQPPPDVRDQ